MTFGYEKLKVYQKARVFTGLASDLLGSVSSGVAACDHLERGAESIVLNIAHSSSSWSPRERIVYLGSANGSALECAACLDVLVARRRLAADVVRPGKRLLREIVSMLIAMKTTTANRVQESESVEYGKDEAKLFSHENLTVYQEALQFANWFESISSNMTCSANLLSKLDKSSTSIILNIAEGNGRFSGADHVKFMRIAFKATIQSASLLDLCGSRRLTNDDPMSEGLALLHHIAAMLTSLAKVVSPHT